MLRPTVCALVVLVSSGLGTRHSAHAADKPVPTQEAAARMTAPPGFTVTLFAGEPDIVQPIAFTFDTRGRMWVVECVTYPKWLQPGQKGKDRVVVLEDTDGDGKHDKKTVVIDDGFNLSGIELGFGGMYLCSTPNFIFVPLKDDKPSGPPRVLLDGWNLKDAKHNVFNGLAWGPDGWLYGCNGIQTKSWVGAPGTAKEQRQYFDAGVWRYHPTKKVFDVVATGTTNPWGVDWDDRGEMFITNCVIDHLWHVVPGGRYVRMYGQDPYPYAYTLMPSCVDYKHWAGGHWTDSRFDKATGTAKKEHGDAGGGHAHSGCAIYLGDNFPAEYRNTLFTCNIHGNRLNNDGLVRTPNGMKGVRRPDFLFANDPWFRGVAVKQGPDGALYVADWSDTGECHNYDVADITNGRIVRVAYGKAKWTGDVAKMTGDELWRLQLSKNEWLVRTARRILQERAAAGTPCKAPDDVAENPKVDALGQWRILATAHAAGQLPHGNYVDMIGDTDPTVATWGLRLWADALRFEQDPKRKKFLTEGVPYPAAEVAARTKEGILLAAFADAFAKLPAGPTKWNALRALLTAPDTVTAANLSQMRWYAAAAAVAADPAAGLKLIEDTASRTVRTNATRLIVTLPKSDLGKQLELVLPLAAVTKDNDVREDVLRGVSAALDDRRTVPQPAAWKDIYPPANATAAVEELSTDLALKFGDDRAVAALAFQATHHREPAGRVRAIEKLATLKKPDLKFGEVLRTMLSDPAVRGAAVKGLAYYPEPETAAALLKAYPALTPTEKTDAVLTLASRPAFALALLDAVEKGTVPKADVSAFAARQILALNSKPAAEKLAAVWGTVKPAAANRVEQTARLKTFLTADYVKAGDLPRGRALFDRSCAACHKLFGDGGAVGPELTGSQRANLDYVLENILDPSAAVANEYKMTAFALADGRTVTGVVRKESAAAVVVRTVNEELTIPKADIESRKATPLSVMPEGLLDTFKDDEIRDLIAYLAAKDQVKPK